MNAVHRSSVLAVALVACGVLATPAKATVVVVPEMPELVSKVDVIVHAKVLAQTFAQEGGRVWTHTTLQVVDGLKGAKLGDTLVVHQLGGRMGDRQMWIPGAHKFAVGEELMFFGMRWAKGGADAVIPFGVGYGLFDVVADEAGRLVVREIVGDVVAYKQAADGTRAPTQLTPRAWPSVDAFKDEVRGLMQTERAGVGFTAPKRLLQPKVRGGVR
jgi:hypothetical protein